MVVLDIEKNKEEYKNLFKKVIKQYPQAKNLLKWIESTDFFTAPASSMYHYNIDGGLCAHSLHVYNHLTDLIEHEYNNNYEFLETTEGGVALVALCHDLCKCNTYVKDYKNVKVRDMYGKLTDNLGRYDWKTEEYWKKDEQLIYGHGSKSVMIIQTFIQGLTLAEILAIRYHQGGFENPGEVDPGTTPTYNNYPLALLCHLSDMLASYKDEYIPEKNNV